MGGMKVEGRGSQNIWEVSGHSMGEMWKGFCPNIIESFLENIVRRNRNETQTSLKRPPPSPSGVGVPSQAPSNGREVKQLQIHTQQACKYLECGNRVSLKSSPLQGMKTQPLQSLFVGKVQLKQLTKCLLPFKFLLLTINVHVGVLLVGATPEQSLALVQAAL